MEHRCSVRKSFTSQLLIYKNGLPVQSGVTRNLGLGGVFVDVAICGWRKHECLEIEFVGSGKTGMRLPAVVVHQTAHGVGLMFDSMSGEQRRTLRGWLFGNGADAAGATAADVVAPVKSRAVA